MSLLQIFSLVLLVAAFALAIWRHVNVGLVIIPAGFILALVAKLGVATYFKGFPGDLVILVVGVMYLFGHAQRSGAIDRLITAAERTTRRTDWLLPWIMFAVAALISGIGALPAASLAIVVPVAMRTAQLRRINAMLMGVVTIMGALAAGFSPISVWGQLVESLVHKAGLTISGAALFMIEFGLNTLVAVIAFLVFGGVALVRRGRDGPPHPPRGETEGSARLARYQIGSLAGLLVFVCAVLVFSLDVGLTAFTVGLALHLLFRPDGKEVIRDLPWSVALVITGVLLYVGLLSKTGTFEAISRGLEGIHSPVFSILALAFFGSLFASFESSSVAVLGVVVPVVLQLTHGVSPTGLLLILCAVVWAVVSVSTSPYHLSGGLVLASSDESTQTGLFRRLFLWSVGVAVLVPLVGWVIPLAAG